MRRLLYIAVAIAGFLVGRALFAQDSAASNIPAANIPIPVQPVTYLPQWYGSAGGGAVIPGKGRFAYQAVAVFIGQASYATAVTEYTFIKGQVQSCSLAGITKVIYQFGRFSIGNTDLAGGCTSTPESGGAAAAVQMFGSLQVFKGVSLLVTGDKTFTQDGKQAVKVTFGVSYGR